MSSPVHVLASLCCRPPDALASNQESARPESLSSQLQLGRVSMAYLVLSASDHSNRFPEPRRGKNAHHQHATASARPEAWRRRSKWGRTKAFLSSIHTLRRLVAQPTAHDGHLGMAVHSPLSAICSCNSRATERRAGQDKTGQGAYLPSPRTNARTGLAAKEMASARRNTMFQLLSPSRRPSSALHPGPGPGRKLQIQRTLSVASWGTRYFDKPRSIPAYGVLLDFTLTNLAGPYLSRLCLPCSLSWSMDGHGCSPSLGLGRWSHLPALST